MEDPEAQTQQEIAEDAAHKPTDETTGREALETALMDDDQSELGEDIGDEID